MCEVASNADCRFSRDRRRPDHQFQGGGIGGLGGGTMPPSPACDDLPERRRRGDAQFWGLPVKKRLLAIAP